MSTAHGTEATPTEGSIEALEAAVTTQRDALAADLEELGARLAPEALKAQARQSVREAGQRATDRLRELRDDALDGDLKSLAICAAGIAVVGGLACLTAIKTARAVGRLRR